MLKCLCSHPANFSNSFLPILSLTLFFHSVRLLVQNSTLNARCKLIDISVKIRRNKAYHFPVLVKHPKTAHVLVPRSRRSAHTWAQAFESVKWVSQMGMLSFLAGSMSTLLYIKMSVCYTRVCHHAKPSVWGVPNAQNPFVFTWSSLFQGKMNFVVWSLVSCFLGLSLITSTSFTPLCTSPCPLATQMHVQPLVCHSSSPLEWTFHLDLFSHLNIIHVQVTGAKYMASTNQTFSKCLLNECKIEWIDRLVYFAACLASLNHLVFFLFSIIHSYSLCLPQSIFIESLWCVRHWALCQHEWDMVPTSLEGPEGCTPDYVGSESGSHSWWTSPATESRALKCCLGEDAEEENIILILRLSQLTG